MSDSLESRRDFCTVNVIDDLNREGLWIEVDVESFQILGFEYRDHLGNQTRIRFFNIREGVAFDNGEFEFKIPSGVEIFRTPNPLAKP